MWSPPLHRVVTAEPELLLHQCVSWVAASHLTELEDALGVVSLTEGDAVGNLAHLDAKVEAKKAEVAHIKLLLHLRLELLHLFLLGAGDDQVSM